MACHTVQCIDDMIRSGSQRRSADAASVAVTPLTRNEATEPLKFGRCASDRRMLSIVLESARVRSLLGLLEPSSGTAVMPAVVVPEEGGGG